MSEEWKDRLVVWAMVTALALGFLWGCALRLFCWRRRDVDEDAPDI